MSENPSLRTQASEKAYRLAPKKDISKLESKRLGELKLIPNQYPYDAFYSKNDMLVDGSGDFWDYWIELGRLYITNEIDYDQIIMNLPRRQSQPRVFHCHLVNFKDREDFKL